MYCTNYMGAIDQGRTQMCVQGSGGKMSGNICISIGVVLVLEIVVRLLVHITEVVLICMEFLCINAIKIYCYKNLLL